MADAGRPADFADLNPEFASRLANFRAALDQAGIKYNVVSGYRTPEYQNQMYQNHLAKQAGQPLPYPNVEAPGVVAPPWRSFHNYGLATDFTATNPADYARIRALAPQFGLSGIGASDPGHIQLAGTLADDIKQYNLAGWRPETRPAPETGAIAYTGGPPAGQPPASLQTRGTPGYAYYGLNNPGNIGFSPWTEQHGGKTSSATDTGHQIASFPDLATGYAAMNELALNKYRGGATTLNQLIAGKNGWTPNNTIAASNIAKMLGISPDDDLGLTDATKMAAFQRALTQQETGSSRQYDAYKAGTTLTTTPPGIVDPSIVAHGGTSPPLPATGTPATTVAAAPAAPAAPSFTDAAAKGDVGGMLHAALTKPVTKDAQGNTIEGKSLADKVAGAFGADKQQGAPEIPAMQPAMPVQDPDPGLAPAASQLFSTVSQAAARPLSWSARPYGSNAGFQGTTLNQTGYGGYG